MQPLTKRQREILDYLNEFIQQHGYAPSLEEIGQRFGLSSLATVHKHLTNLQDKGFIRRSWNRSRSVELLPRRTGGRSIELPMLGYVAAGMPIEAIASTETICVPESLVGQPARHLRASGARRFDDRRADSRRRLGHRRGPQDGEQRRDGRGAARGLGRDAQVVLSRQRANPAAAGESDDAADLRGPERRADPRRRGWGDADATEPRHSARVRAPAAKLAGWRIGSRSISPLSPTTGRAPTDSMPISARSTTRHSTSR